MHDVFISYSSKDYPQAETVRNILEKNSIPGWMAPRDIPYGSNYAKEIPSAIRECQVFVLILSRNAQSSQWVLRELDSAVNCGKVIFPFMLEDCLLNDEFNFLLTGAQRYAAYQKKSEAMETLIKQIKAVIRTNDAEPADTDIPAAPVCQSVSANAAPFVPGLRCPACGSEDLQELTKKIGTFSAAEHLISLLAPALSVVGAFVMMIVAAIIWASISIPFGDTAIVLISFFGGGALGWVLGKCIANEQIRRRRVRSHIHPHPYCCNACKKKFLKEEPSVN